MIKSDNEATYCISDRTLIGKISDWLSSLEEIRTRINGQKKFQDITQKRKSLLDFPTLPG